MQPTPNTPNMIKMAKMLLLRDFLRTMAHTSFLFSVYTRITFIKGFANIFIERAEAMEEKIKHFVNQ